MVWGVLVWFGVFWGDSMDPYFEHSLIYAKTYNK